MLVMSAAFVAPSWRSAGTGSANLTESRLELPFSFWVAVKYGVLFLVLHVVGVLAQHFAGQNGFYLVSVLGGLGIERERRSGRRKPCRQRHVCRPM